MTRIKPEGKKKGQDGKMEGYLSNERTLLSWTRTGLSIFTIGCAIARLGGSNSSHISLRNPGSQKKPIISGLIVSKLASFMRCQSRQQCCVTQRARLKTRCLSFLISPLAYAAALYVITVHNEHLSIDSFLTIDDRIINNECDAF